MNKTVNDKEIDNIINKKSNIKQATNKGTKKTKMVINKELIIIVIMFLIFIIYTLLVKFNIFNKLDSVTESTVIGLRNSTLTNFMSTITNLGGAHFLISTTLIIALIAIIKNRSLPVNTMINLTSVFLLNELIKQIVRRPRPNGMFLAEASGFSYPSGHTIVSFAFYTFIAISLCEKIKSKVLKLIIKLGSIILPLIIALSRVYLGVHYITDIIGGYLLGYTYLKLFLYFRKKHIKKIRGNKWK